MAPRTVQMEAKQLQRELTSGDTSTVLGLCPGGPLGGLPFGQQTGHHVVTAPGASPKPAGQNPPCAVNS